MYCLKRPHGRNSIPIADMVEAIASTIVDGRSSSDAVTTIYEKIGKKPPKSTAGTMLAWRRKLNALLEAGDQTAIKLCRECEIIDETDDTEPARRKSAKKKAASSAVV